MTLFLISIIYWLTMLVPVSAGLTAREWGIRAQCHAACLKKFGSVRTNPVSHIYDLYRVHKCSSDMCKQCLNPCNWILSTPTICQRQCVTDGCKDSCKLLYDLHDKINTAKEVNRSPKQLRLDSPVVVCKETPPRLPFSGPDLGQLFIRWNVRELDGNSTFAPVVFIIAVKGQQHGDAQQHWTVLGKTNYAFLPIQNLSAGATYKFQVTAVTDDGVVDEPRETEWTTTLAEGAVGDPPQDIRLLEQNIDGKSMTAVVEWTHGRDPACYFKMYWMTTGETQYNQEEVREPLPEPKLQLSGLQFDSNYTVHAYAFDREFKRSASTGKGWFVTAKCLQATGGNFSICSPGLVKKLSHRIVGWHRADQLVDVSLQWMAPKFSSDHNRILSYTIEWRKMPALHSVLSLDPPHMNGTTVAGNQTSLIIRGVHMNSVYSVWVRAQTLGGTSLPSKLVLPIGGENSFHLGAAKQYDKSPNSTDLSNTTYIISLVVGPVVLSSVVLVIVLLIRWRRKQISEVGQQKFACLREVNPLYGFEDIPEIVIDYPCLVRDGYEVRWEDISLLELIGEGAFGRVMKAQLLNGPIKISDDFVAIKMTREHLASEDEKRDLLLEIDLMKEIGYHPNVVSMLGCCTQGPNICLIMDYCPLGDLRNYLKKHRPEVYCDLPRSSEGDQSSHGDSGFGPSKGPVPPYDDRCRKARQGSDSFPSSESDKEVHCYTNPSLDATVQISGDTEPGENDVTDTQLLSYAWQIAGGMEYLGQQKYVHRDLAARNVLMYTDKCVKISDFGLTRDVYETSVYTPTAGKKIPVKWMPLEAIFDQTFTSKSDVWSFGVVLWEILMMGSTPYPGVDPRELLSLLKSGYRMSQPDNCKDEVYELMLKCWREKPADRPTFSSIRETLEKIMELDQSYMDLQGVPDLSETETGEAGRPGQADCSPCFRTCLTPTADTVLTGDGADWAEVPVACCVDNPAMDSDVTIDQHISAYDTACTPKFHCLGNSYKQQP